MLNTKTLSCSTPCSEARAACCGSCDKHGLPSELSHLPIFSGLSSRSHGLITAQISHAAFTRGQTVFLQDDAADFVYIIRSGWVKLFRETIDGQEAIIDILTRGHIFGDTSFFNNNIYQYGAQTVEDLHVFRLPLSLFQTLIAEDSQFTFNLMNTMVRYRREQDMEVEHRSLQNASQRIGCFLLRLLPLNHHTGAQTIHIPYDKLLLAGRLGMKPETLSRGLSRLKEDLDLVVKGGTVHVPDVEQLANYTCSACTHNFPCDDLK